MALTLYHSRRSTCSRRVRACLGEKGLAFEERVLDLRRFEHHDAAYLALNPNGYVPTLVHDGVAIIESTVINEYLDEVFPDPPLKPEAPLDRVRMRLWCKFADEQALPAVVVPTWSEALAPAVAGLDDAELRERLARVPLEERRRRWEKIAREGYSAEEFRAAHATLLRMFTLMQADLVSRPFLGGDRLSLADTNILPYVVRAREIDPSLGEPERFPAVLAWQERLRGRPWYAAIYGDA